jgi:hypothetical protein
MSIIRNNAEKSSLIVPDVERELLIYFEFQTHQRQMNHLFLD